MHSLLLSLLIAALLFIASLIIEIDTAKIASSEAAEAAAEVSESELRQLFPGQFHAIAYGLIKVRITALADGSLIAKQIGKLPNRLANQIPAPGTSAQVNSASSSRNG